MAINVITANHKNKGFSCYDDAQDSQLVLLMQAGDDRALNTLMRRYRALVYRAVKAYLGNLNDAEDVFQDITLSLFQNRNAYQIGAAKFSSWLYRVAVNKCLDILRLSRSRAHHGELHDAIPDKAITAEDKIQKNQMIEKLEELLSILPQQQKRALSHYYYDEMNIIDIAEKMGLTDQAVRSLIKRGKEKIRSTDFVSIN